MAASTGSDLPTLAVIYSQQSVQPMELAAALEGIAKLLWVVDVEDPHTSTTCRFLRRLGTVVVTAGSSDDDGARLLEPLGPRGMLTLADDQLLRAAALTGRLGLAGLSPPVVEALTNKFVQRERLAGAGLASPRSVSVAAGTDPSEVLDRAATLRPPLIIKPKFGAGSRDTFALETLESLRCLLQERGAPVDDVVVEEMIEDGWDRRARPTADYVSVESVVTHGEISHLAITGRLPLQDPFRESGFFIPADLDEVTVSEVLDVAGRAASALGVTVGALHTEIKLTPSGPQIIEVNGRIGGGVPALMALATGTSFYELAARAAFGEDLRTQGLLPCTQLAYLWYVHAPAGRYFLESIEGLSDLVGPHDVGQVRLNRQPGEHVDSRDGNHGHLYSVLGSAPTLGEMLQRHEATLASVKVGLAPPRDSDTHPLERAPS